MTADPDNVMMEVLSVLDRHSDKMIDQYRKHRDGYNEGAADESERCYGLVAALCYEKWGLTYFRHRP